MRTFEGTWCAHEEREKRMELALRCIERFERRLSLQAPFSIAACVASLTLLFSGAAMLVTGFKTVTPHNSCLFPVLLLCFLLAFALSFGAFLFAVLSMGFSGKGPKTANLLHPFHHHHLPCSSEEFAQRFTGIPRQELYVSALDELYFLRVKGKKLIKYLRNSYFCLGLTAFFVFIFALSSLL
jgi:hypothetical protein